MEEGIGSEIINWLLILAVFIAPLISGIKKRKVAIDQQTQTDEVDNIPLPRSSAEILMEETEKNEYKSRFGRSNMYNNSALPGDNSTSSLVDLATNKPFFEHTDEDETDEDINQTIIKGFNLHDAVIYSEIMKPKYEEY